VDVREFIESGILESYVLGLASADERREVERMISEHPEVRRELDVIEDSVAAYAKLQAKEPPAAVREKVFASLGIEEKEEVRMIEHPAAKSSGVQRFLAAASVALLIVSSIFNYILYNRLNETRQELAELNAEKEYLAQQFELTKTEYEQMQEQMAVMNDENSVRVMMRGVESHPDAMASVYWNKETRDVMIVVHNLPEPPAGHQYQLWALDNGQPVDAGVFEMGDMSKEMQKMKEVTSAQAFAVTLEKAGGSPSPTLTAMYVMGGI
jgi:anti-sigma-K factor RskA